MGSIGGAAAAVRGGSAAISSCAATASAGDVTHLDAKAYVAVVNRASMQIAFGIAFRTIATLLGGAKHEGMSAATNSNL